MITTIVTSVIDYQQQAREAQELEAYITELAAIIPGLKLKDSTRAFERYGYTVVMEYAKKHGRLP